MIALPRRSVTRFFIPLIDVLILLFCIFLLMPFVNAPATPEPEPDTKPAPAPELSTDVKELQKQLADAARERDEAKRRLERYQKDRAERLVVRVLEIDPDSGKLVYYAPGRQEVSSQAQAEQLVAYQKRLAGEKDAYFLILYPRRASKHPVEADLEAYRTWFKDVPYGFDIPRAGG